MRYFAGLFIIVLIFIVGIILLFGGNGNKKPSSTSQISSLPEYASTDAKVIFTKDGTINGDDIHRAIRISVSKDQRLIEVVQGYSGYIIDSRSQQNSENAYRVFLKAINNSGFLVQRKGVREGTDYTAICPLQNRYTLTLQKDGKNLSQLWTSDCGIATGNFSGAFDTVQILFQNQITNYRDIANQVQLNQ